MAAAGRIRFSSLILLIVVLNVVAYHVTGHNAVTSNALLESEIAEKVLNETNTEGYSEARTNSSETTTFLPTETSHSTGLQIQSTLLDESGLSNVDDTAGKWCLKLVTESNGSTSSMSSSSASDSYYHEDLPNPQFYLSSVTSGNQCGAFGPRSQNATQMVILSVHVRYPSVSETLLCVEFVQGSDKYVENVTVVGEGSFMLVKPGESETITGLKHCRSYHYVVKVMCKSGKSMSRTITVDNRWFLVQLESRPDAIAWSYPVEGLPCIKEFRIDLDFPLRNQTWQNRTFVHVRDGEKTSFNLSLEDTRDLCYSKNVTVTPIYINDDKGTPVTQYSEVTLIIDPVVSTSTRSVIIDWNNTVLFEKCVKEIRAFKGNSTEIRIPPEHKTTFKKIDACRLHTFTIELIDLDGISRSRVVKNATNLEVGGGGSVVDLKLMKNVSQYTGIGISWKPPKGMAYCVQLYHVEEQYIDIKSRQSHNGSVMVQAPATSSRLNASDVCSLVSVSITPVSLNGSRWATTSCVLQGSVQNLRIQSLSSSSVNISWDSPKNSSECVIYYSIFMRKYPESPRNSTSSSIMIDNLKPCINYNFVVVPVNRYGSKHLSAIASISMPPSTAKKVEVFVDEIRWNLPVDGSSCSTLFQIIQRKTENNVLTANDTIDAKDLKLENLEPITYSFRKNSSFTCVQLQISITPVSRSGHLGVTFDAIMPPPKPGPVHNVTVDIRVEHHVTLTWMKPELFPECVSSFRISYGNRNVTIPNNQRTFTIRNLTSCMEYNFTITSVDFSGKDAESVIINATVKEEKTDGVVNLQLMKNVSQYTGIRWNPPDGTVFCVGSYLVEEQYIDVESRQRLNGSFMVQSNETSSRLNAKDVCSLVSASVTPVSLTGSRWTTTALDVRYPVQNLRIQPLSPSTVKISWDPPQDSSGCVKHYSIFWERTSLHFWNSTSCSRLINDLEPCKNYTFKVVPVNRHGLEHPSADASISMPEQHISSVQQVESFGDVIRWNLPTKGSSCISRFEVIQRSNNNPIPIANTIIPVEKSKARTNDPFYHFRKQSILPCALLARLKYSIIPVSLSGKRGDLYIVTSPPPKPGPVRNVTINTSVERQVTLSWIKPELYPECVSSYRISYDDRNLTIPSNETTLTIENLNSCMEYNFTITSVDFSGKDAESVLINATVKEEKLSGVQDLELSEVDPGLLMAKWKPPVNGTYCVASYRYVVWVSGDRDLPEQISNSTTDEYVTFVDMFACTTYNVQVIPVSKGNNDGNNEIAVIKTKERVILRYHIDPVRIRNQTADSLELQTALTIDNNNFCELLSVRFTCTTNNVPEGEDPIVITGEAEITVPVFSAVVTPLKPFNEYNCTAAILNIAGWSDETTVTTFETNEDFPEHPQNLQLVGGYGMIELSWMAPRVKNGIITRYRVHIRSEGARYPTPSYCPLPDPYNSTYDLHEEDEDLCSKRLMNWNNDELNHTICKLQPYTDYVVQVAAATKAGLGPYTEMVSVSTLPEQPDPVHEFSEYDVTLPEIDKPYNSSVNITWNIPCHLNGRLLNFTGQFVGNGYRSEHTFSWSRTIDPSEEILETYSIMEQRLEPEFQYNVSIMVFVDTVANHSDAKFLTFKSPAGIPNITKETNWGTVNVMDSPNPTRTAKIRLSDIIFEPNVGNILYVALLVSERRCQVDPDPQRNLSNEWPEMLSWKVAAQMPCIPQYQTTPEKWNPTEKEQLRRRADQEIVYVIGKDHCDEEQKYCNGALKPGTEYALIVRVFTNSGFSDSAIQIFKTDSLIQLTVIVSSIFVCLLLAFALGLVILWRTQKLMLPPQTAGRSPNEEPADIPLKSFSGIYEELIQSNREKINKEYQAINFFSEQLIAEKVTFFVAKENERKNRYLGIFPYDGNRVLLEVDDIIADEDEEVNDYINASFIDGYKYQREYIATQGPKKETCFDFWRMILQYEVESIVMLTQTVENDRIKCYQYFPRFNQTFRFRDVSVKCTQELNLGFYQKRLFVVTRDNLSKAVFHYHFLAWPDHGCPTSASDLIKFIKIIRSERKNLALPVVVHCSAGVGRTGTLIALDVILQRIQQEKKINIYDTVKQLRTQRVKMVQTSEQYAFLYHACLEYTTRNNRKKPKTSTEEITSSTRSSPNTPSSVVPKSGRRPIINIKFPKYVHSGISNVKSYPPDDVESNK